MQAVARRMPLLRVVLAAFLLIAAPSAVQVDWGSFRDVRTCPMMLWQTCGRVVPWWVLRLLQPNCMWCGACVSRCRLENPAHAP